MLYSITFIMFNMILLTVHSIMFLTFFVIFFTPFFIMLFWGANVFVRVLLYSLCLVHCLQTPALTIANNAGVEGPVVVGKLLEQDNLDLGYDAAKGTPHPTMGHIRGLIRVQRT